MMEKKNNSIEEIWKKLKSCKRILMTLHYGPDGDSLGSCTAMKYVLEREGIKVKLLSKDDMDVVMKSYYLSKEVEFGKGVEDEHLKDYDLLLILDSGNLKQSVGRDKGFKDNIFKISIDHHSSNDYYADMNFVNIKRSSCCSILLDIFKELKLDIDSELATRLILGIYTDTGFFAHDDGSCLNDAAFLFNKGARYREIVDMIRFNTPLNVKRYYALLTNKFKVVDKGKYKFGYSSVSLKDINDLGLNLSEVRYGANYLQEIGGLDFIFTLGEQEKGIKGSFRSRHIDISKFAEALGGGGHKLAAAFILPKISLQEAEKKVLEVIEKIGVHRIKE